MSCLISFLNVGRRFASSSGNLLLLGANYKDDHEVVVRFTKKLASDIEAIKKKSYTVMRNEITF